MLFLLKILAFFTSLLFMTGCGMHSNMKYTDMALYPYRYADFDYKYAWKTTDTDKGLLIDGVMKNVRYAYINSVDLTVNVIGKDGKKVAKAVGFPMPQHSREGDKCYFSLLLRDVKPAPGDIFQFQVHYIGNDGDRRSGVNWHSSFKVEAMTGAGIHEPSKKTDNW